jgi:glyoxylase-like metal-dependent hydrolase (beta-lactamase superfamily II)
MYQHKTLKLMISCSHVHFDHIGDMSKLPNSTNLLVGAGTKAAAFPGYPEDPESMNLATDFEYVVLDMLSITLI